MQYSAVQVATQNPQNFHQNIKAKSLRHFAPVRKQFCIKVTLILAEKSTENNAKQLQKNCKYRRKESENGFQIKSKETKEE